MNFSIKDFLSKCDQIRRKLQIWSHLLKKSLMGIFIFCAVHNMLKWSSPEGFSKSSASSAQVPEYLSALRGPEWFTCLSVQVPK